MKLFNCENLEKTGLCKTFYTGIDGGMWLYDNKEDYADYESLAKTLGININQMARVYQKHTANVKIVGKDDVGIGIYKEGEKQYYDAMVTNEKNIMLTTVEADCVPVYLLDTKNKTIAMIHSGWRGTALKIISNTLKLMNTIYKTEGQDVYAFIGPHNCEKCYEVGEDVREEFSKSFSKEAVIKYFVKHTNNQSSPDENKYMLNLKGFIITTLAENGVAPQNIEASPYCTYHEDLFPSYRRTKKLTSRILTGIMLK